MSTPAVRFDPGISLAIDALYSMNALSVSLMARGFVSPHGRDLLIEDGCKFRIYEPPEPNGTEALITIDNNERTLYLSAYKDDELVLQFALPESKSEGWRCTHGGFELQTPVHGGYTPQIVAAIAAVLRG